MASHCGGFSCCAVQAPGHVGLAVARGLLPSGICDLLGPGMESVSPALVGRFLLTYHQGSPLSAIILKIFPGGDLLF